MGYSFSNKNNHHIKNTYNHPSNFQQLFNLISFHLLINILLSIHIATIPHVLACFLSYSNLVTGVLPYRPSIHILTHIDIFPNFFSLPKVIIFIKIEIVIQIILSHFK